MHAASSRRRRSADGAAERGCCPFFERSRTNGHRARGASSVSMPRSGHDGCSPPAVGGLPTMPEKTTVKPTLGLTGVTVNAMALIAPGAFLWITYQLQAAATAPDGSSVASDIWAGIGLALVLAFLTAISYAQLARLYPEAGFGSCYYFAEKAFLDRENRDHHKFARLAKLVTGWAAHLFYWVYPGCMVAFMATLIGYIWQQFTGATLSWTSLAIIC